MVYFTTKYFDTQILKINSCKAKQTRQMLTGKIFYSFMVSGIIKFILKSLIWCLQLHFISFGFLPQQLC